MSLGDTCTGISISVFCWGLVGNRSEVFTDWTWLNHIGGLYGPTCVLVHACASIASEAETATVPSWIFLVQKCTLPNHAKFLWRAVYEMNDQFLLPLPSLACIRSSSFIRHGTPKLLNGDPKKFLRFFFDFCWVIGPLVFSLLLGVENAHMSGPVYGCFLSTLPSTFCTMCCWGSSIMFNPHPCLLERQNAPKPTVLYCPCPFPTQAAASGRIIPRTVHLANLWVWRGAQFWQHFKTTTKLGNEKLLSSFLTVLLSQCNIHPVLFH